jgi:hypothetical protein
MQYNKADSFSTKPVLLCNLEINHGKNHERYAKMKDSGIELLGEVHV